MNDSIALRNSWFLALKITYFYSLLLSLHLGLPHLRLTGQPSAFKNFSTFMDAEVLRYTARNVHHLSTMFIFSVNAAYHKQQKALELGEGMLTLNLSGEVQLTSLFRLVRNRPHTCIKQFFYNFKTIESKPVRTRRSLVLMTPPFRIKVSAPRLHRWLKKFYL